MINKLLYETKNKRKREILQELKKCNKEANEIMLNVHLRYTSFKFKYSKLQKEYVWTKGRQLLLEWFNYPKKCMFCGKTMRRVILHHKEYSLSDTFTPDLVAFICPECHEKEHNKS